MMQNHLKLGFSRANELGWTTSLRVWMSPDILNSAAQKIRAGGDPRLVTDSVPKPNVKYGHSPLCCSRMMVLNNLCEILTQHKLRHHGGLCPLSMRFESTCEDFCAILETLFFVLCEKSPY